MSTKQIVQDLLIREIVVRSPQHQGQGGGAGGKAPEEPPANCSCKIEIDF
jgi:hypothetical protein